MAKWLRLLVAASLLSAVFMIGCADEDEDNGGGVTGSISLLAPNGGEEWGIGVSDTIRWVANNLTGNVRIEANYAWPANTWDQIASSVPASSGQYVWVVPTVTGQQTNAARIRVVSASQSTVGDTSANNFTITMCPSTCAQAVPISVGSATSCSFTTFVGDTFRFFRVDLQGRDYRFRLTNTPASADYDLYVAQACSDQSWWRYSINVGNEDTTWTANAGSYIVAVHRAAAIAGNFELIISQAAPQSVIMPESPPVFTPSRKTAVGTPGL